MDAFEVICGDALLELPKLDECSVDAVVTDPPYSSGGMYRGDHAGMGTLAKYSHTDTKRKLPEFSGDNRDQRAYGVWVAMWSAQALRLTVAGGSLLCFTDWRQLPTTIDAVQAGGWVMRGITAALRCRCSRPS